MDSLHDIAARILSALYNSYFLQSDSVDDDRVVMEAVRTASLETTVRLFDSDRERKSPVFTQVTRLAENHDVDKTHVFEIVEELIGAGSESIDPTVVETVRGLDRRDRADLLATLHSLGSHTHPSRGRQLKTLRPLGSFYTPREITDAIVSLTIGPLLNEYGVSVGDSFPVESLSLSCLDPACGPGGFLVSAYYQTWDFLAQHLEDLSKAERRQLDTRIVNGLYGVDLDAAALEIAAVSLEIVTDNSVSAQSLLGRTLKQGDALISMNGLDGKTDHSRLINPDDGWSPFEWPQEFPEVFSGPSNGFDVVVMNPPYERLKPNLAEFLRERLDSGDRIIRTNAFNQHTKRISHLVTYFRRSPDYRFSNRYTIDTHRLFIERALRLLHPGGRLGLIVPTSILGDLSAQPLRKHILYENTLEQVLEFPESARVFPGVTQAVTILVVQKGSTTEVMEIRTGIENIENALMTDPLRVSVQDIERVMGDTAKIPQVNQHTWSIALQIHRHPRISEYSKILNLRGELDLTMCKEFITDEDTGVPLVRGSHIQRFGLTAPRRKGYEFVHVDRFVESQASSRRTRHIDRQRIACQQVSNRTQRWRLKFALIEPPRVLANSCNYIIPIEEDSALLSYLLGVMNSTLLNWRFKLSSTNNHVSNREIGALPLVSPTSKDPKIRELIDRIVEVVHRAVYDRVDVSYELDALVFMLYGIDPSDAREILLEMGAPFEEISGVLDLMEGDKR